MKASNSVCEPGETPIERVAALVDAGIVSRVRRLLMDATGSAT